MLDIPEYLDAIGIDLSKQIKRISNKQGFSFCLWWWHTNWSSCVDIIDDKLFLNWVEHYCRTVLNNLLFEKWHCIMVAQKSVVSALDDTVLCVCVGVHWLMFRHCQNTPLGGRTLFFLSVLISVTFGVCSWFLFVDIQIQKTNQCNLLPLGLVWCMCSLMLSNC